MAQRPLTGTISCFSRFEGVGIYVVMFGEIMKTLVRIVMLFLFLVLAFALTFHALMLNQVGEESNNQRIIIKNKEKQNSPLNGPKKFTLWMHERPFFH